MHSPGHIPSAEAHNDIRVNGRELRFEGPLKTAATAVEVLLLEYEQGLRLGKWVGARLRHWSASQSFCPPTTCTRGAARRRLGPSHGIYAVYTASKP